MKNLSLVGRRTIRNQYTMQKQLLVERLIFELDYEEYEVVLVNDGSTDQTQEIIQELIENDERFELITTTNQGPGLARNEGIRQSKGEYLLFFDADDTPVKRSCQIMIIC